MSKHFENNDLDETYSRWNAGNGLEHVLPPLSIGKKLVMIKIKDGEYTRVDFKLVDFDGLLIFHELLSDRKYGFDISDIALDKIYFRTHGDYGNVWKRLSIESVDDLLKFFD